MAGSAAHKEFFAVRTVGEALAGFRPARRTAVQTVALGPVLSVLGIDRGAAAAREHPKDREDTET